MLKFIQEQQQLSPLTISQIIELINEYVHLYFPERNLIIGKAWFRSFRARYPGQLVIRKSIARSQERIESQEESTLKQFIHNLEDLLKNKDPSLIHNVDESPFFWNLTLLKVRIQIFKAS